MEHTPERTLAAGPVITSIPDYLLVDELRIPTSVACLRLNADAEMLVSFVVLPLVDFGATRRMFGRQWLIRSPSDQLVLTCVVDDAFLAVAGTDVTPTVSWNASALGQEDIYVAVISVHDCAERLVEERAVELVYLTRSTQAVFGRCQVGRYVGEYFSGLVTAGRFAALLTNQCTVSLRDKRVLVSGCGTGGECAIAQDMGAREVVGIDTAPHTIAAAETRYSRRKAFRVYHYDGITIPEADSSFDVVISRHVLEHVPLETRWLYCRELFRVLSEGGVAIVEFPNQRCPVEAHTNLEFFHLLPQTTKWEILRYYGKCEAAGAERHPRLDQYLALSARINVTREEFLYYIDNLPARLRIINEYRLHPQLGTIDDECCPILRYEIEKV